jgi:zinc transport system ATP-binding protein
MRIALKLLKPDDGEVKCAKNITIGYMPQKIMIDHSLPLNVLEFLNLRSGTTLGECKKVLTVVGAIHTISSPIQTVSGGEMQRILLARAILGKPDLLVLDEPVQGVDITGQEAIYNIIADLRDKLNCGILMISHDLHLVMSGTDHVVCLNTHVCCSGAPSQIQEAPEYRALLGDTVSTGLSLYKHSHDHHHDTDGEIIHSNDGKIIKDDHRHD